MGTSMTCSTSGTKLSRIFRTATIESTSCGSGSWRRGRTGAESAICTTIRRGTRSCGLTPERRSGREPPSSGTLSLSSRLKYRVPGSEGWVLPERGRVLHLEPTPWPWLSPVPVGRCGATLQPGPSRRSSAHASAMSGAVAPAAFVRLPQRCQHEQSTS